MIGLQLFLAMAATGVDYGWQYDDGGRLEYIIQIEPELLDALRDGQELRSVIDPQLRHVRSFRIRVGRDTPPRDPISPESQRAEGGSGREDVIDNGYSSARTVESDREQPNHAPPPLRRPNEGETAPSAGEPAYPYGHPDTVDGDLDTQDSRQYPDADPRPIGDSATRQFNGSAYDDQHSTMERYPWLADPNIGSRASGSGAAQPASPDPADGRSSSRQSNGSAYDDQHSTMERYPWLADPNIGSRASDTGAAQPASPDPADGRSSYDNTPVDGPALQQPDFDREPGMLQQVPPTEARNITAAHESQVGGERTEVGAPGSEMEGNTEDPSPADAEDRERQETIRPLMGQSTVSLALFASLGGNAYLGWICYGLYGRYRRLAAEIAQQQNGDQEDD